MSVRVLLGGIAFLAVVAVTATERHLAASEPFQNAAAAQDANTQPGSVRDGIFTAEQALRGQRTFQLVCISCHTIAEHSGRNFADKWVGSTVADMFGLIADTMPDGDPGSLKPEEYANVVAFLLKENGYPEGKQELPATPAALMRYRIEPLP